MANRELRLDADMNDPGGTVEATVWVEWHEETAMFAVKEWQSRYPTAEHVVHSLERSGFDIEPHSYDQLFALDEEVSKEVGDALLLADASRSLVSVVTPRDQVVQAMRLRGDGYIPADDLAAMVAPATFTAQSVDRQVDIDVVSSDMARIVGSMIDQTPLKVRALQVWGIAKLGSDSPIAQQALEEAMRIDPTRVTSSRQALETHLWGPSATATANPRPGLRRASDPTVEATVVGLGT